MYFSESKSTVDNSNLYSSQYTLPDCLQETKAQPIFTSNAVVPNFSSLGWISENYESAPIRFLFDETSEPWLEFSMFDSEAGEHRGLADSCCQKKTLIPFQKWKHHETLCDDPAEKVSPNIPKSMNSTIKTLSTPQANHHTSNIFIADPEFFELNQISTVISNIETDLNKIVNDMISESNLENEKPTLHKVEVTHTNPKRMRKSAFQVKILEHELQKNKTWSKYDILDVCK